MTISLYKVADEYPAAPAGWRLRVHGLVARPLDLSLADLRRLTNLARGSAAQSRAISETRTPRQDATADQPSTQWCREDGQVGGRGRLPTRPHGGYWEDLGYEWFAGV